MEDRGWRMEDGGWRIEDRGWRMEDRGWRMEDGGWRMEDGGWRMEDGGWRMEDGGWRMERLLPSTFYPLPSSSPRPVAVRVNIRSLRVGKDHFGRPFQALRAVEKPRHSEAGR